VIDAFAAAKAKSFPSLSLRKRKLISMADKAKIPYVRMPDLHLQPRMATGSA